MAVSPCKPINLLATLIKGGDLKVVSTPLEDAFLASKKTIQAEVQNMGGATVTSFNINYKIDAGSTFTSTINGISIAPGEKYMAISTEKWIAQPGLHEVTIWVDNINEGTDLNPLDNTISVNVNSLFKMPLRQLLYEHFTQASCGPCAVSNPPAIAAIKANKSKVAAIWYHTSWPGYDPMYNEEPGDPDARVSYYKISGVPNSIVEGGLVYNGSPGSVNSNSIKQWFNNLPPSSWEISLNETKTNSKASLTVDLTPLAAYNGTNLVAHVVITEEVVEYAQAPGSNGEKNFDWVERKMLTGTAGQAIPKLALGEKYTLTLDYDFPSWVNKENLRTVIFIQDKSKKDIAQAFEAEAATGTNTGVTSTVEVFKIDVFTNNTSCHGAHDGFASIIPKEGVTPFTYVWSNGAVGQVVSGLAAGTYNVSVTDGNGIQNNYDVVIEEPAGGLEVNVNKSTPDNNKTWSVDLNITSGKAPYVVDWYQLPNNTKVASGENVTLSGGVYNYTIKDADKVCQGGQVNLEFPVGIADIANNFALYPNPASNNLTLTLNTAATHLILTDLAGHTTLQVPISKGVLTSNIDISHLADGMYICTLHNNSNIIGSTKLTIIH
ncbi:MAG: Omp28-related outer membrane protein [Sphingobacteriales bacterium]|nr:Omp28-related outer membrane protein [Sphingobacteriales bacterium]